MTATEDALKAMENVKRSVTGFQPGLNIKSDPRSKPQAGTEPPSGEKGKGTTDSPYDGGNAPENQAAVEPPSGVQGEGSIASPYDGGNAPENPPAKDSVHESSPVAHKSSGIPEGILPPGREKSIKKSGIPEGILSPERAGSVKKSGIPEGILSPERAGSIKKTKEEKKQPSNIAFATGSVSKSTSDEPASQFSKAKADAEADEKAEAIRRKLSKASTTRSLSPGTRKDGAHMATADDRGLTYEPGVKEKIKGFFHRNH